jgi:hypothetical protein
MSLPIPHRANGRIKSSIRDLLHGNVSDPSATSFPRYNRHMKLFRLNTRRTIRGRGTDAQGGATTNNTNMFHLGTRLPSMAPTDLDRWDVVYPPALMKTQDDHQTQDHPQELHYNSYYGRQDK